MDDADAATGDQRQRPPPPLNEEFSRQEKLELAKRRLKSFQQRKRKSSIEDVSTQLPPQPSDDPIPFFAAAAEDANTQSISSSTKVVQTRSSPIAAFAADVSTADFVSTSSSYSSQQQTTFVSVTSTNVAVNDADIPFGSPVKNASFDIGSPAKVLPSNDSAIPFGSPTKVSSSNAPPSLLKSVSSNAPTSPSKIVSSNAPMSPAKTTTPPVNGSHKAPLSTQNHSSDSERLLNDARLRIQQLEKQNSELLQSFQRETGDLRRALDAKEDSLRRLEQEKSGRLSEWDQQQRNLADKLKGLEQEKMKLQQQLNAQGEQSRKVEQDLRRELHNMNQIQRNNNDSQMVKMQQELNEKAEQVTELLQQIAQRDATIGRLQQDLEDQVVAAAQTHKELTSFKEAVDHLDQVISQKDAQIEQLKQSDSSRQSELQQLQVASGADKSKIKELEEQVQALISDIASQKNTNQEMSEQLQEKQRKLDAMGQECADLRKSLDDSKSAELARLVELETKVAGLVEGIEQQKQENQTLQKSLNEKDQELIRISDELAERSSPVHMITAEQVADLEQQLNTEKAKVQQFTHQCTELQEQIEFIRRETDVYRVEVTDKTSELEKVKVEFESLKKERDQLKHSLDGTRAELAQRIESIAMVQQQLDSVKSERDSMQNSLKVKEDEIESMNEQTAELRANCQNLELDLDSKMRYIADTRKEVDRLTAQADLLVALQEEAELQKNELRILRESSSEAQLQAAQLFKTRQDLEAHRRLLEEKSSELLTTLETLTSVQEELDRTNQQLHDSKQKVSELEQDLGSLRTTMVELEVSKSQIAELKKAGENFQSVISRLEHTVAVQKSELEKLFGVQEQHQVALEKIRSLEEVQTSLNSELTEKRQLVQNLEQEIISVKEQALILQKTKAAEMDGNVEQLKKHYDDSVGKLVEENKNLNKTVREQQTSLSNAQRQMEENERKHRNVTNENIKKLGEIQEKLAADEKELHLTGAEVSQLRAYLVQNGSTFEWPEDSPLHVKSRIVLTEAAETLANYLQKEIVLREKLEFAERELEKLASENTVSKKTVHEKLVDTEKLASDLEKLKAEQQRWASEQKSVDSLLKTIEKCTHSHQEFAKLQLRDGLNSALASRFAVIINHCQNHIQKLVHECDRTAAEGSKWNQMYEEMRQQAAILSSSRTDDVASMEELRSQRRVLEEQLHNMRTQLHDMTEQWKKACDVVKQRNAEIDRQELQFKSDLEQSRKELNKIQTQLQKIQHNYEEARDAKKNADELVAKLRDDYRSIEATMLKERESTSSSLDMLEHLLADEKERNRQLQETVHSLRIAIAEKERSLSPMSSHSHDGQAGSRLLERIHILENEKTELTRLLESATVQAEESFSAAEKLRMQLDLVRKTGPETTLPTASESGLLDRLKPILTKVETSAEISRVSAPVSFDHVVSRLSSAVDHLVQRVSSQKQIVALHQESQEVAAEKERTIQNLQNQLDTLRSQMNHLMHSNENLHATVSGIKIQHEFSDSSMTRAAVIPSPVDSIVPELQHRLAESDARIAELSRTIQTEAFQFESQIKIKNEKIAHLETEITDLRLKVQRLAEAAETVSRPHITEDLSEVVSVLRIQISEKDAELSRLRISQMQQANEADTFQKQAEDAELSLKHAENTIALLNGEVERRIEEVKKLRLERDQALQEVEKLKIHPPVVEPELPSPGLEKQLEFAFRHTAETAHVIDELVRLASSVEATANATVSAVRLDDVSKIEMDIRMIREYTIRASAELDRIWIELRPHHGALAPLRQAIDEQRTLSAKVQDSISSLASIASQAVSSEMKQYQQQSSVHIAELEALQKLLHQNDQEINLLRSTIQDMVKNEKLSRHAPSNEEHRATYQLLQSHIQQIRQVWEHEVNANEVLRKLLAEVRQTYAEGEKEFIQALERIHRDQEAMQKRIAEFEKADSSKAELVREKSTEYTRLLSDYEREKHNWQVLQTAWQEERESMLVKLEQTSKLLQITNAEFEGKENQWYSQKETLVRELDALKNVVEQVRNPHNASVYQAREEVIQMIDEHARKEQEWRSEREKLVEQIQELSDAVPQLSQKHQRDVERLFNEKRALEMALTETTTKWTQNKLSWEEELSSLKQKYRDEKESLLERFRAKLMEYESVNQTLINEKEELEMKLKSLEATTADRRTQAQRDEIVALHKEIASIRDEQLKLNENLQKERQQLQEQQQEILFYRKREIPPSRFAQSTQDPNLLNREKERHREHCRRLMQDVHGLRLRLRRECGYRADLIFQKNYLLMIMGGIESSERAALNIIGNMGIAFPNRFGTHASPKFKLKRAMTTVLCLTRIKLLRVKTQQAAERQSISCSLDRLSAPSKENLAQSQFALNRQHEPKFPNFPAQNNREIQKLQEQMDHLRKENDRLTRKMDAVHTKELEEMVKRQTAEAQVAALNKVLRQSISSSHRSSHDASAPPKSPGGRNSKWRI